MQRLIISKLYMIAKVSLFSLLFGFTSTSYAEYYVVGPGAAPCADCGYVVTTTRQHCRYHHKRHRRGCHYPFYTGSGQEVEYEWVTYDR